jgi:hypothetical protein
MDHSIAVAGVSSTAPVSIASALASVLFPDMGGPTMQQVGGTMTVGVALAAAPRYSVGDAQNLTRLACDEQK